MAASRPDAQHERRSRRNHLVHIAYVRLWHRSHSRYPARQPAYALRPDCHPPALAHPRPLPHDRLISHQQRCLTHWTYVLLRQVWCVARSHPAQLGDPDRRWRQFRPISTQRPGVGDQVDAFSRAGGENDFIFRTRVQKPCHGATHGFIFVGRKVR